MGDEQPDMEAERGRYFINDELERFATGTSFTEFRTLPEVELERRFEALARSGEIGFLFGPDDYLNELTRRETLRQNKRLEWLTWALVALTIVITVATVALLVRE